LSFVSVMLHLHLHKKVKLEPKRNLMAKGPSLAQKIYQLATYWSLLIIPKERIAEAAHTSPPKGHDVCPEAGHDLYLTPL
jgi:hypothetical protein